MHCAVGSWLCGAESVTSPLRVVGGVRGNPTAPVISLHKIEKAGDKAMQGAFAFCDFLVVISGSSLNFFFFLTLREGFCPMYLSQCKM